MVSRSFSISRAAVFHFAVVADQDAGEALQLAVSLDLDAVDVGDERIGVGRGGEQRCGEREEGFVHGQPHSIVRAALKG